MSKTKTHLVVIDPGLQHMSGHHLGFISALSDSLGEERSSFKIVVLAHQNVNQNIPHQFNSSCLEVVPFFTIDFYELYGELYNLASANYYISALAMEYKEAINQYHGCSDLFLYPTIGWEHASAIAYANQQRDAGSSALHVVCLMFSPGVNHDGVTSSKRDIINYRIAIGALSKTSRVKLFASDFELSKKYQVVLAQNEPLPIHPCYLDDWSYRPEKRSNEGLRIGLYTGDAKPDKGFLDLPNILDELLEGLPTTAGVFIQYTNHQRDTQIDATVQKLKKIAKSDVRVRIINQYWNDKELKRYLSNIDFMIFTYHEAAYKEKSSGFLWLAYWYKCHILCLQNTWINREAARLGIGCKHLSVRGIIDEILGQIPNKLTCYKENNQYKEQIFRPFLPWLTSLAIDVQKQSN